MTAKYILNAQDDAVKSHVKIIFSINFEKREFDPDSIIPGNPFQIDVKMTEDT